MFNFLIIVSQQFHFKSFAIQIPIDNFVYIIHLQQYLFMSNPFLDLLPYIVCVTYFYHIGFLTYFVKRKIQHH